jgi:Tryptophan synthase alpha chain
MNPKKQPVGGGRTRTLAVSPNGTTEMPIIWFSYCNPIFVFGNRRFARKAAEAEADGVLVVDLPFEERWSCGNSPPPLSDHESDRREYLGGGRRSHHFDGKNPVKNTLFFK